MRIYNGLSEEERQKVGTKEYMDHFSGIDTQEGSDHNKLWHLLHGYSEKYDDVDLIYLAMFDEKNSRVIYIIDPQNEQFSPPGEWEPVDREEVQRFLHPAGNGPLYYINHNEKYGWICTAGAPVIDENRTTVAFVFGDVSIGTIIRDIVYYAIQITIALLIMAIIISILIVRRIRRTIVDPINMIASAAEGYAKEKKTGNSSANNFSSLDINTGDEIENLSHVMADMESDISDYMEDLTEMTAKEERVKAELSMASKIQASSLPDPKSAIADSERFSLYADMKPAKTVGGDFYDFFMTDDDHLAFVIADVSDKGVPAALFMMSAKNLINYRAREGGTPAQILSSVNAQLCRNNGSRMFVTVWLGILDTTCGRLLYANAGHEPIAISHEGEGFEFVTGAKKPAVGIISGIDYTDQELMLMPQDKVFLYTDGITEAADDKGAFFGSDRLIDALNTSDGSPADVINGVGDRITSFVKDAEQFDDMTMLCLLYKSKGEG
jgi:sigma-B regulation protein RsbU (phosphoserine phosphatase)